MAQDLIEQEEKSPVDALPEIDLLFLYEYIGRKFNAAEAYRATYGDQEPEKLADRTARLMKRPDIKKALAQLLKEAIEPAKARGEYQIVRLLNGLVSTNIFDYVTFGGALREDLTEDQLAEFGRMVQGFDQWGRPKIVDRFKAIELYAKYLKLIKDGEELEKIGTINIYLAPKDKSAEEWNRARELEAAKSEAVDADVIKAMEED